MFKKTDRRMAIGTCDRVAEQIARAARAMGFSAQTLDSRISASTYVEVTTDSFRSDWNGDEDFYFKIRVSDHADRHGGADFRVYCDARAAAVTGEGDWKDAVAWLAGKTGRVIPGRIAALIEKDRIAAEAQAALAKQQAAEFAARNEQIAAFEAAIVAWNPARWSEINTITEGKRRRRHRQEYRRQAMAALGLVRP